MSADLGYTHMVLTRYFVGYSAGVSENDALTEAQLQWLEDRFHIFRDICLPSVANQTDCNFTWLLYFGKNVPSQYISRVQDLIEPYPNFKIVLCENFDDETRQLTVRRELSPDTRWLLTSRLDNDDGWHRDFVKILHENVHAGVREFLNFPVGIIYYRNKTFLYRHASNAFISFFEPVEEFKTVYCETHVNLSRIAPIRQAPVFPAFIQVVHAGTKSNKPRGVRVHRMLALVGFETRAFGADGASAERDWDIVSYNLRVALAWKLRDDLASVVRKWLRR
jgi:hypothetical protein